MQICLSALGLPFELVAGRHQPFSQSVCGEKQLMGERSASLAALCREGISSSVSGSTERFNFSKEAILSASQLQ